LEDIPGKISENRHFGLTQSHFPLSSAPLRISA